jgi:hypothetical protein
MIRAQVVDQVERAASGVQQAGVGLAGGVGEQAEDADQDQQGADDQVAEQHVEQQFLVGPLRAVRVPPQVRRCRVGDQAAEVEPGLVHLGDDRGAVQGGGRRA